MYQSSTSCSIFFVTLLKQTNWCIAKNRVPCIFKGSSIKERLLEAVIISMKIFFSDLRRSSIDIRLHPSLPFRIFALAAKNGPQTIQLWLENWEVLQFPSGRRRRKNKSQDIVKDFTFLASFKIGLQSPPA